MQDVSSPLDSGFDACAHHTALDERHKTPFLIWCVNPTPVGERMSGRQLIARPVDSFCDVFRATGDISRVETVATQSGRIVCRPTTSDD